MPFSVNHRTGRRFLHVGGRLPGETVFYNMCVSALSDGAPPAKHSYICGMAGQYTSGQNRRVQPPWSFPGSGIVGCRTFIIKQEDYVFVRL